MRIRFQIDLPPAESFPWEHDGPRLTVGRLADCDLSFRGPMGEIVSGRHAQILWSANGAVLTDLGSTNGTFLNGVRLTQPAVLNVGDQILLGQAGPRLDVILIEAAPSSLTAGPAAGAQSPPPLLLQPEDESSPNRLAPALACVGAAAALLLVACVIWLLLRKESSPVDPSVAVVEAEPESSDSQQEDAAGESTAGTPDRPAPSPPGPVDPLPPSPTPAVAIDEKPWMSANLVLVNPVHYAIAIKEAGEPPTYTVTAKEEGENAAAAAEVAWQSGISIITDEQLTRRIYGGIQQGDTLGEVDTADLNRKWREFRIAPRNSEMVVFNDLKQRRTRLGYLAAAREFDPSQSETKWFRDVRGKQPEPFQPDYVQSGTLRSRLTDDVLLKTPGLDFLDYCLYRLAGALVTPPGTRESLNIYVVGDVSAIAMPENRNDMIRHYPVFSPRPDELRMRSEADRLKDESERMASELRARLSDLGVPVAEWSKELAFGSYDSDFRRPEFKKAQESELLGISHVLLFRVRTPHSQGMYELSMRLVDVRSGRLLWEGQADRLRPEDSVFDLASSPYLMHTGKLALLELVSDEAIIDPSTRAWARGGVPLHLPEVKIKSDSKQSPGIPDLKQKPRPKRPWHHAYNSPEEMWGQHLRFGYLESEPQSEQSPIVFRDLFSSHIQTIPREGISAIGRIETDAEVPPAHEMRYLVWRLAKFILPTAGRVTEVSQQRVKLTLCRMDGIKQGDRLTARRSSDATSGELSASEMVLPHELIVTETTDVDSLANVERLEGVDSQETLAIEVGDIVHRRPARRIVVGVLKPRVDMNAALSLGMQRSKTRASDYTDLEEATQWVGDQLSQMLQNAMVRLRLAVVERSALQAVVDQQKNENFDTNPALAVDIGRVTGATHVILGDVSPGLYNEMRVGLRVVEVDTGMVMEQINFKFKRAQFEGWVP